MAAHKKAVHVHEEKHHDEKHATPAEVEIVRPDADWTKEGESGFQKAIAERHAQSSVKGKAAAAAPKKK